MTGLIRPNIFMKINISEEQRFEIDDASSTLSAASEVLLSTSDQIELLAIEREKSASKVTEIEGAKIPTEKQVHDLLVARERSALINARIEKLSEKSEAQKRELIRAIHDGSETVRRVASKQIEEATKAQLIGSLPTSVRNSDHLVVSIWAGSAEKRAIGRFLNPSPPKQNDAAETILLAAADLLARLQNLLAGREIVLPTEAAQTAENAVGV